VTLCAPAAVNDTLAEAVPLAVVPAPVKTAAVPVTVPVPMVLPPAINVTFPVGPAPLLPVAIAAVKVTAWPTGTEATPPLLAVVVVGAVVIVKESAGEVLAVKLLSPE
jgi:hypothetical protein